MTMFRDEDEPLEEFHERLHQRAEEVLARRVPDILVVCAVCDKAIESTDTTVETIKGPVHGFPKRCVYRFT